MNLVYSLIPGGNLCKIETCLPHIESPVANTEYDIREKWGPLQKMVDNVNKAVFGTVGVCHTHTCSIFTTVKGAGWIVKKNLQSNARPIMILGNPSDKFCM